MKIYISRVNREVAGRVGSGQEVLKSHGSGRVGSGDFQISRVASGQVGSAVFKISRVGSSRVKKVSISRGSGRVKSTHLKKFAGHPTRPDPTREV